MVVGGSSALLAARDIRDKLATVAAAMLEAEPERRSALGTAGSSTGSRTRDRRSRDVAYAVYPLAFATAAMVEPPLEATRAYKPENINHVPDEKGRIQPYPTYSNAVHAAVVEVDVETGKVDDRSASASLTTAAR